MKGVSRNRANVEWTRPVEACRRILIVDDHLRSAECLASIVKMWGYETRFANLGAAAISEAISFHPDVVLLDIDMPDMDGYAVAQALRREPSFDSTLIVAMTGHSSEADIQKARKAGFDRHFVKPLEIDALRDCLAQATQVDQGR
jgi:two-component system CheB/CheR fusion protein